MSTNPRVFLWLALALALWFNYEAWVRDYGAAPATSNGTAAQAKPQDADAPTSLDSAIPAVPSTTSQQNAAPEAVRADAPALRAADEQSVRVLTNVLDVRINLQGGTIEQADLLRYPEVKGEAKPVRLLNRDSPESLYLLQTGLTGPQGSPHPTHLSKFTSARSEYRLGGAKALRVPLVWTDDRGITVTKTFIFRPGQYRIDLEQRVDNRSPDEWKGASYAQILRTHPPVERSMFSVESYAFKGPAISDGERYRKLDIEDEEDRSLSLEVRNGWIAALQHHFVSAIVPPGDAPNRISLNAEGQKYLLSTAGPLLNVAPGSSESFRTSLFVGPKLQSQLEQIAPLLERVADYGKLTLLAAPLFWVLEKVHDIFGNWGVAIIVVTLLLKLLFYPLSEASGKSMARMRTLTPRIRNLQETHKGDREKLGRAMMELYQREKVNPVAGCLPMLVQIPVFLAFYWVLLESVEMRQAPFVGWIDDLSARDPYFVLPLIMAGAMFIQYKLNPAPPDPVQAKVFMIMPIAMSAMFAFFPAGLVLYWVTNTVLSIAQQWNINRRIEHAAKKS